MTLDHEPMRYNTKESLLNPEFLAVQEDLLLRILDVVEKAGASVAFPSQTVYVRGSGSPPSARKPSVRRCGFLA